MKLIQTFAIVGTLLLSTLGFSSVLHDVAPEVAAKHLQQRVEPVYPTEPSVRIRGDVVLQLEISTNGTVTAIKAVSGHPLLIGAALDAVQKWRYRPFLLNGKPIAVRTRVTIPFYPLYEREEALRYDARSDLFFETFDLCREQITHRQLVDAEATCKKAAALSLLLSEAQQLERMDAVKETGHALFLQGKFSEALDSYEAELHIAENLLKPFHAEVAAAHYYVADALWRTGHLDAAALHYTKAESGYKQAVAHIDSAFLRNEVLLGTDRGL
jgi:TonB family protein